MEFMIVRFYNNLYNVYYICHLKIKKMSDLALQKDLKKHWEKVYSKNELTGLGWYEKNPEASLILIEKCDLPKDAAILNVGVGASTLVDFLLEEGYQNIIASDLSVIALEHLSNRIGDTDKVQFIVDDLTNPTELPKLKTIDLWHDRAVLHFFTDEADRKTYFDLLKCLIKTGSYVILASFNLESATKCSGLPVYRFDKQMLQEELGEDFSLVEAFDYSYTMPSGDNRSYVYTLFKRN